MPRFSSPDSLIRSGESNLASALEAYEASCTQLFTDWQDLGHVAAANVFMAAIRTHADGIPSLTVLALKLNVAHANLVSAMWQKRSIGIEADQLQEMLDHHASAVDAVRLSSRMILTTGRAAATQKPAIRSIGRGNGTDRLDH